MVSYVPIMNKLTSEGIEKFIELNELSSKIVKGTNKRTLTENLTAKIREDDTIRDQFQDFYKKLEEAGRKHYFLYRVEYPVVLKQNIESALSGFIDESTRNFDPTSDDGKVFFSRTDRSVVVKRIRIRKSYSLIEFHEEDSKLVRTYDVQLIHYIEFIRFNYYNNTMIMGYDAHGELFERRVIEKEFIAFAKTIMGEQYFNTVQSLITSDKIERIRHSPNCLVSSLSNRMNVSNKTVFTKGRSDVDRILADVRRAKYRVDQIKENNPDFDVQTHPAFEASMERSIEADMEVSNNGMELFFFTSKLGKPFAFRFRVDLERDLLITFSDSVTREELEDVLTQFS